MIGIVFGFIAGLLKVAVLRQIYIWFGVIGIGLPEISYWNFWGLCALALWGTTDFTARALSTVDSDLVSEEKHIAAQLRACGAYVLMFLIAGTVAHFTVG